MTPRKNENMLWDIFYKFESEHRNKLLLSGLTYWTTESEVFEILDSVVKDCVNTIKIFEDQTNGLSVGFCCVSFNSPSAINEIKNQLQSCEKKLSSTESWIPVVIPFSKQEFKRLLEEAITIGRIRNQRDMNDRSEDTYDYESNENWNTKDYSNTNRNLSGYNTSVKTFPPPPPRYHNVIPPRPLSYSQMPQSYGYRNSNPWTPFSSPYPSVFPTPPPPSLPPIPRSPYPMNFQPMYTPPPPPPQPYSNRPLTQMNDERKVKADKRMANKMENDRRNASKAIRKATEAHLDGKTKEGRKILKTAIADIEKSSKESNDKKYKTLLWSLEDTLSSMLDNSSDHREKVSKSSPKSSRNGSDKKKEVRSSKEISKRNHSAEKNAPTKKRNTPSSNNDLKKHSKR